MFRAIWAIVLALALLPGCSSEPVEDFSVPQRVIADIPANPWPEAASVRIFAQKPMETGGEMVREEGQLLTVEERRSLEEHIRLISYNRGPESVAACFIPHHFLRYYDRSGKEIGELSICFCCKGIQDAPHTPPAKAAGAGYSEMTFNEGLEPAVAALGYDTRVDCFDKPAA